MSSITMSAAFLKQVKGGPTKNLLVRENDVWVLHGIETVVNSWAYLKSCFFKTGVVKELKPLLFADPDVRIYATAG